MGPVTKRVPDVYGKTEAAANSELKSYGFTTVITEIPSDDVEAGLVVKTDPQCTEVVGEGAKITIYVSSGKPIKNVKVPDVIALKKSDAEDKLKEVGLVPEIVETQISHEDRFLPIDYVAKQEPEASSNEVPEGTTVKIYVVTGYKFNIYLESLPTDFETENYYISLWRDGKLFDKGDKINSSEINEYTFDELTVKDISVDLTVRISSDGKKEYDLYEVAVNNKTGKVNIVYRYQNYPKKSSDRE